MPIARVIADPNVQATAFNPVGTDLLAAGTDIYTIDAPELIGGAWELRSGPGSLEPLRASLQRHFADTDVLVAEHQPAIPDLFISDMDSTMIGQECIDELADYAGLKPQIAQITERAMQGELDFEAALRERVALLKGLDEGAIQRCIDERIEPMPGARVLVQTLRAHGCCSVLVTGGFHHFADRVGEELGFDHVVGNRLEVSGGVLTGGLIGTVVDNAVKRQVLKQEVSRMGEGAISLAMGDGANDVPMLNAADYGIAYHAKPAAQEVANGWIGQGDLRSVLTLLGIPKEQWAAR